LRAGGRDCIRSGVATPYRARSCSPFLKSKARRSPRAVTQLADTARVAQMTQDKDKVNQWEYPLLKESYDRFQLQKFVGSYRDKEEDSTVSEWLRSEERY